jgi:hypothetical protein
MTRYTNPPEFHDFTNHWTACANCHPRHDRYCAVGKRLHDLYHAASTKPDVNERLDQLAPVITIRRKKR